MYVFNAISFLFQNVFWNCASINLVFVFHQRLAREQDSVTEQDSFTGDVIISIVKTLFAVSVFDWFLLINVV